MDIASWPEIASGTSSKPAPISSPATKKPSIGRSPNLAPIPAPASNSKAPSFSPIAKPHSQESYIRTKLEYLSSKGLLKALRKSIEAMAVGR